MSPDERLFGILFFNTGERYEQDSSRIHRKKLFVSLRDDQRDCYRTSIRKQGIAAYIRYCFELKKGTKSSGMAETDLMKVFWV